MSDTTDRPWCLVTGNGPYGALAVGAEHHMTANPSGRVAQTLDGETVAGRSIVGRVLDDEETGRLLTVRRFFEETLARPNPPEMILSLGVFSTVPTIRVERIAVNVKDYQFADDDGYRAIDEPVVEGGPDAFFSTLPIKAIVKALRENGIPASISNSASTHGCNAIMYSALYAASACSHVVRAGFLHLPDSPEHVAGLGAQSASMNVADMCRGVRIALQAALTTQRDLKIPPNEYDW